MHIEHTISKSRSTGNNLIFCNNYGHALFKKIELEIGGQTIDTLDGLWLSINADLTEENPYGIKINIKNYLALALVNLVLLLQ